jgi:sugar lactone lactonase YvrE
MTSLNMKYISRLLLGTFALVTAATLMRAQSTGAIYEPYSFTTFAGSAGSTGSADGLGSAAQFFRPQSVAVDGNQNTYVGERRNHTIRKITPSGAVTTLAGLAGNLGSTDGTGSEARFWEIFGVAADRVGNVYVADSGNRILRKITPSGVVSTLAGRAGSSGTADGTGSAARFGSLHGVAVDGAGHLYVADGANNRIRKVTPSGTVSTLGDGTGNAARFNGPHGVAVDSAGNLYVAETSNHAILKITPSGPITTLAGMPGSSGSADGSGSAARFKEPEDLAVDAAGNVYVADWGNNTIRKITPSGNVTTIGGVPGSAAASTDGSGSAARFGFAKGVAVDSSGKVYVADTDNHTIRVGVPGGGAPTPTPIPVVAPTGVVNISTRLSVQTGENVLIGGFIVAGNAPKKMIVRAIGPSLTANGALQDPVLQLLQGQTVLGSNDNWRSTQEQAINDTTIPPRHERESAVVATLNPGAYTFVVSGKDGGTGIGLVEAYDLGTVSGGSSSNARLANISTRGFVQSGDEVMIGGFIVSGAAAKVIVRAIGPSLTTNGVAGALQDTTLDLRDGNGSLIIANDDWRTGGQEQQIKDTTIPPTDDRESAVVATLNPGAYTAVVRGKNNSTGVALVEAYVLQ